jgi:raffinose/stachyose/melibiose transport system substrate-binding protein
MKKVTIALILLMLCGIGLSPVAGQSADLSGELRIWGVSGNIQTWLDTAIEQFTSEHPDVSIEVTASSGGGTSEVIPLFVQVIQGDDPPDIAYTWAYAHYREVARAGLLEPLDDLWDAEWDGNVLFRDIVSVDGVPYGVIYETSLIPSLFYNKQILDEADAWPANGQYYTSSEEVMEAAKRIRDAGYEPISDGFRQGGGGPISHLFGALLGSCVNEEAFASYINPTEATDYTNSEFLMPLEVLNEWNDAGVFAVSSLARNDDEARAVFFNELSAMLLSFQSAVPALYEADPFEWGWMPLPAIASDCDVPFQSVSDREFVIPSGSDNIELAKAFLSFLMSQEMQLELAKYRSPSRTDLPADQLAEVLDPVTIQMYDAMAEHGTVQFWETNLPGDLMPTARGLMQEMFAGQRSPESVGEALQARLTEVLEEE